MACSCRVIPPVHPVWRFSWSYPRGMCILSFHFLTFLFNFIYLQLFPDHCFHLFCNSYPLLNIPLPGTIPTKVILPYEDQATIKSPTILNSSDIPTASGNVTYEQPPFPWANSDPFVYIQQIVLRSSVLPWRKNLLLTDAYRGPLHEIFKLLEIVRNHEEETAKTNLANLCLHVENVKMPTKSSSVFPEYNCLILSPANLWQQNAQNFKKDTNLLSTIFHHHVSQILKRKPL